MQNASPGTGALATIYSDDGVTPVSGSVVTTDSSGTFSFYAPDGRYDLTASASGVTKIVGDVVVQDILESSTGDGNAKFPLVQTGSGTAGAPTFAFTTDTTTGFFRQAASVIGVAIAGTCRWLLNATGAILGSGGAIGWSSNADPSAAGGDSFLSRISANVLGLGNSIGGSNGELRLTKVNKITLTQPATAATLTLADNSTLTGQATGTIVNRDSTDTLTNKTYGGTTQNFQAFTSSGTFTIPANVKSVKATVVAGGGAGGGATVAISGGGGASGGMAIKYLTGLTPGNTITVTVGAGGTGVNAANGNNGADSSISSGTQSITTVTAKFGGGGFATVAQSPGGASGGISTNGDINGAGTAGANACAGASGEGASTFLGGAGNAAGGGAGNNAIANTGSGGSGGFIGGNSAGGNGAAGIVIFEWIT